MVEDRIELLDPDILKDQDKLKLIAYWLRVMNWPNGWHYDLDIIWILQYIERLNLPKGATIIDAGSGLGVTQFILAASGYNVISLDFTVRQIPRFSKGIFEIEIFDRDLGQYAHEYMDFMKYNQTQESRKKKRTISSVIKKACDPKRWAFNQYVLKERFKEYFNFSYLLEKSKEHKSFGKITFLRGSFNEIPLADNTADVLISVSAFEHNTYKDMPGSINEFMRVVKKGDPLLITTSASEKEDWFFEPSKGWNFSKETLSQWFGIREDKVSFDYQSVLNKIIDNRILEDRLSSFYKFHGNNGLPYGVLKEAKYIPVGIVKVKTANEL